MFEMLYLRDLLYKYTIKYPIIPVNIEYLLPVK